MILAARGGGEFPKAALMAVKTESGAEYFKSWRELPAFEYNEVENVYRFMRHIEKLEGKRVLPIPGPKH